MNTQDFEAKLAEFVKLIQQKTDEYYKKNLSNLTPDIITVDRGHKFVRIVKNGQGHSTQRSVWGFVEIATGSIYKAAGWKAPAKHARGSIYSDDPWAGMNTHGPNYLR